MLVGDIVAVYLVPVVDFVECSNLVLQLAVSIQVGGKFLSFFIMSMMIQPSHLEFIFLAIPL